MDDIFTKVACTYCQEDINGVRVQCCVCPEFDICLQCFSSGAEIGPHKNDHSFKVVHHSAVRLFEGRGNWTGQEEHRLLDAVELYGFGSWKLVSDYVETRTPDEVRDEYTARYLEGNIGKATWAELKNRRPIVIDHVPEDNGPLSPVVTSRLPPLEITPEEARLVDYRPHRDDYEREYNMEAEQLVAKLQLDTKEDSEMEIALKLSMVDMYTRRLRERAKRKRIVRDYQLVAKFFSNIKKEPLKKTVSKMHSRDLREKMIVFAQFYSSAEHERLLASMERERELRFRLSELLRYRSLGLTTQEEIVHYEQHVTYQKQQLSQNKSGSSGYAAPESQSKNGSEDDQSTSAERSTSPPIDEEPGSSCSNNQRLGLASLSIKALPLASLLSDTEIQLCTCLKLLPVQYISLKFAILQENKSTPKENVVLPKIDDSSRDLTVKEVVTQYLSCSGALPGVSVV